VSKKRVLDPKYRSYINNLRQKAASAPGGRVTEKEVVIIPFKAKKIGKPSAGYVKNDGFYESKEWKQARYQTLRDHGRRCACCGATPATGAIMHVDHIKPRYKFPELSLDLNNLQVLCSDCNEGKGAWDSTDFRPGVKQLYKTPKAKA
jgi:5-methylcytosine-specific restriction endonuclease McrA